MNVDQISMESRWKVDEKVRWKGQKFIGRDRVYILIGRTAIQVGAATANLDLVGSDPWKFFHGWTPTFDRFRSNFGAVREGRFGMVPGMPARHAEPCPGPPILACLG